MLLIIFTLIVINLFLSLDNIIPILLIADSLKTKKQKDMALFLGLFLGALMRIVLVFFAGLIFHLGTVVYIASGLFLLYIGLKGVLKKEENEVEGKPLKAPDFKSVVYSIIVIDVALSIDNVAALIAITQNFALLMVGIITSVLILFGISFFINQIIKKIKGLDTAAYLAIIFLAFKFLAFPFGVDISNTITSAAILLICVMTVGYIYLGAPQLGRR